MNKQFLDPFSSGITKFGRLYNRYSVVGLKKIPKEGPALLVFYHGFVPLDLFYFGMTLYKKTGRPPVALTDKVGMRTPLLKDFFSAVGAVEGTREAAKRALTEGKIVGVAPGGLKEAIAGHEFDYKLVWGNRTGFAQIAIEAQVDIYPCFTKNVESLYKNPLGGSLLTDIIYQKAHIPFTPPLGLG
ncbi:MAG: lysophospholipid acyltransferase family protein, partial [Pseudomonadota bacterium]